jgi:DNA-binding MarR family transcriptional regulator
MPQSSKPLPKPKESDVAELMAAMGQLIRRLRAEAKSGEISWSQMAIMARLDGSPLTTADLARAENMKPQSMGAALAQMEEEGLVKRQAHPTDGRQILFALTAAGIEGRYRSRLAKREWMLASIARLDRGDQQKLLAAIPVIKRLAES